MKNGIPGRHNISERKNMNDGKEPKYLKMTQPTLLECSENSELKNTIIILRKTRQMVS